MAIELNVPALFSIRPLSERLGRLSSDVGTGASSCYDTLHTEIRLLYAQAHVHCSIVNREMKLDAIDPGASREHPGAAPGASKQSRRICDTY